jgi:hypothetical protein
MIFLIFQAKRDQKRAEMSTCGVLEDVQEAFENVRL